MSSAEAFKAAMDELRQEQSNAIAVHRADSQALADMTARLNAALQGQVTDVDIAALAAQIHDAAVSLRDGIRDTHTSAADVKTANADASLVQGGQSPGPDVVSASSPGVIQPAPTGAPNSTVPQTLGGGAMPVQEPTAAERAPGEPLPAREGEEPKPASPDVPSVHDTPDVEDAGTKGGKVKAKD